MLQGQIFPKMSVMQVLKYWDTQEGVLQWHILFMPLQRFLPCVNALTLTQSALLIPSLCTTCAVCHCVVVMVNLQVVQMVCNLKVVSNLTRNP